MTDNSFGATVRIYKHNLCRIYCDFDSYEEFNLVDQYGANGEFGKNRTLSLKAAS
jgi:hypothetical protein